MEKIEDTKKAHRGFKSLQALLSYITNQFFVFTVLLLLHADEYVFPFTSLNVQILT